MNPRFVFRVDASVTIGTGHVMRCLTLADALRARGAECRFVTRDLPGHLAAVIEDRGFAVLLLPAPSGPVPQGPPTHVAWAGVSWEQDLADTRTVIDGADWLVVDHYAFDARWQQGLRDRVGRIMVIDDLADRPHAADLLLDQNLGRAAQDYDGLLPEACRRLTGPRFALLRPEFRAARMASLARRGAGQGVRHILISMGGTDMPDATSRVLDALSRADLPGELHLSVVMGRSAPALERVRARAARMPWPTEVLVDVHDMARLMQDADLAIGAGGSTTWERCCLGLPSIIVETADNQAGAVAAMEAEAAALGTGPLLDARFDDRLVQAVGQAQQELEALSQSAARVCDGEGVCRAVTEMGLGQIRVRKARMSDAEAIWHWRHHGDAAAFYLDPTPTPLVDHLAWFETALASPSRDLLIVEYDEQPAAHVRFDRCLQHPDEAEISIYLNPLFRGKSMSTPFLLAAINMRHSSPYKHMIAKAHRSNEPSIRLFISAGFERVSETDQFVTLRTNEKSARFKRDDQQVSEGP
ncbi:UDP-2,4-diacetamido-2,4,6-trideoxy-beta-L-altropyranose hydrolase [Sulfitobacter sp. 1A12779]|uniref:UDP-2,4-diacetamido-2,4, 6-trideoxy-beta-L-altropyranose hydrolase n=1 Tax=Sulfitobacter sp. 1A12779 TaxID=3368599 RepID=UPI0037468422